MTSPTVAISPLSTVFATINQRRRKVEVLVHEAVINGKATRPNYHVKVTNLSPTREIVVTHIWFERSEDEGGPLHLLNPERPLPARLRLDDQYETWIPVAQVAGFVDWATRFRVKLTSGHVIVSRLNKSVPDVGFVAGGGETPYTGAAPTVITTSTTGVDPVIFDIWDPGPSTSTSAVYEPRQPDGESKG